MIKKFLLLLLIFNLTPQTSSAAAPQELNLSRLNTSQLEDIYEYYDYKGVRGYLMLPGYHYPPIYLSSFPTDFDAVADEQKRIALFIKILAPLALRFNQQTLEQRQVIEQIKQNFDKNHELSAEESRIIEKTAAEYDVFTRLKGYQRHKFLLTELLNRVDAVPPSFLIAAAAMETNWGTSRIVKEGNSLYKQLVWHSDKGLKPRGETEDDTYRIRTFPTIYDSLQNFAHKINSHVAFEHLRSFRKELRSRNSVLRGTTFAFTLMWNSPLKNYAGIIEYTIAFYELNIIDKSLLNSKMIDKPLPERFKKLIQSDTGKKEKI